MVRTTLTEPKTAFAGVMLDIYRVDGRVQRGEDAILTFGPLGLCVHGGNSG